MPTCQLRRRRRRLHRKIYKEEGDRRKCANKSGEIPTINDLQKGRPTDDPATGVHKTDRSVDCDGPEKRKHDGAQNAAQQLGSSPLLASRLQMTTTTALKVAVVKTKNLKTIEKYALLIGGIMTTSSDGKFYWTAAETRRGWDFRTVSF